MFADGLENEVESLKSMGLTKDSPAMKAIGYREFFDDEKRDSDSIRSLIKFNTRRYAKKQYTFMRGIPGAVEINADDTDAVVDTIRDFLNQHSVFLPNFCR